MVTKHSFHHNLTCAFNQKTSLINVIQEYELIKEMWIQLVTKRSFCHNLTNASKQKTYLTKVVEDYAIMKEMS